MEVPLGKRDLPLRLLVLVMLAAGGTNALATESIESLLKRATSELAAQQYEAAIRSAGEVLASAPQNVEALALRGEAYDHLGHHAQAIADYDQRIKLRPGDADAYYRRGAVRFKSADVKGSIADFDQQIALQPASEQQHWQRGLSYYYDGQYKNGAKQFELYQTFDAGDVENVVWRFLCQAKDEGVERARAQMLALDRTDRRVPMMKVYDLFFQRATPEDVCAVASEDQAGPWDRTTRMFYAHLYVGLYYDAHGNKPLMRKHILEAEKQKISHYMWDVAHVHATVLRRADTE